MKTPPFNYANITKSYKTDWFVTDQEVKELREYVYQSAPVSAGDIYGGMYLAIHKDDFPKFLAGEKKYRAIAVCEAVMKKVNS
jgi:hypothetical protein